MHGHDAVEAYAAVTPNIRAVRFNKSWHNLHRLSGRCLLLFNTEITENHRDAQRKTLMRAARASNPREAPCSCSV